MAASDSLNPDLFGDPPVPKGHTRVYRGDWAPGGNLDELDNWLDTPEERQRRESDMARRSQHPILKTRSSVEGRWVTPHPKLAATYPLDHEDSAGSATVVNYVDVPDHVWNQIRGLNDQPTEVHHLSRMREHEAVIPQEYKDRMRTSRVWSSKEGLTLADNQDTYL